MRPRLTWGQIWRNSSPIQVEFRKKAPGKYVIGAGDEMGLVTRGIRMEELWEASLP